jgi:hypothetical protein
LFFASWTAGDAIGDPVAHILDRFRRQGGLAERHSAGTGSDGCAIWARALDFQIT